MAGTRRRSTSTHQAPTRSPRRARRPVTEPVLRPADVRQILRDLGINIAPADLQRLLSNEAHLRHQAVLLEDPKLALLRSQVETALDCLRDHVDGRCPQIPYYTVGLLAAGIYYFGDTLDVIPDFLPRIGRLDDALVMSVACDMARAGLERYCVWKGRPLAAVFGVKRSARNSGRRT
jgi:uncharacterized membrane protein YkvA (DUF1232 family)